MSEHLEHSGPDNLAETRPLSDQAEFDDVLRVPEVAPGQSLGRYVILRQLASGGMSVVYVAYDPELNREVALKVMRPGGPEGAHASSERLLREAQAMAQLSHVNVVHVYDVGVVDERVYMAMEYVRGDTLEEWVDKKKRHWKETIDVLIRAGRGLAAAHAAGLVHLDFKPRNVLVGADGEVRVVDFGLARPPRGPESLDNEPLSKSEPGHDLLTTSGRLISPITQYGVVMGTSGYMAAEQLSGDGADARSDQFAFCVTAWVALFGERPFSGATGKDLNRAILLGKVAPPSDPGRAPPWVRRLLEQGLSNDPERRHPDVETLLDQLQIDHLQPWRRGAFGLVVALAIGATAYAVTREEASGPSCEGGGEHLEGVWDEARRRSVNAAIRADPRPFAAEVAESVTRSLDQWSEDWQEMHRESCLATYVRGEQSADLLDLRTRCLRHNLGRARAITATLMEADAKTVENANEAVSTLGSLTECANTEFLQRSMVPLPAEDQAHVDEIFDRLSLAIALTNSGRIIDASVVAMTGLLAAELTEYPPLTVSARKITANTINDLGSSETTRDMLYGALLKAEEAGLDDARLSLMIDLVFMHGIHLGEPERALLMARHAHALVKRLDAPIDQRSRLAANEGAVYGAGGKPHDSIRYYREALRLQLEGETIDRSNMSSVHLGLGASYHLLADYPRALSHFRQARRLLEEEFGPMHPRNATAVENMGTALIGMGRFDEAIAELETAAVIYDEALAPDEFRVNLHLAMSAAMDGLERWDEAERYLRRITDGLSDSAARRPVQAAAFGNLAFIYLDSGRPEEAVPVFERCIELFTKAAGDEHIYLSYFRLGKARALFELDRREALVEVLVPTVTFYRDHAQDTDPLHGGEAALLLARTLHRFEGAAEGEALPPGLQALADDKTVEQWADEAERLLKASGITGQRPLRRLEKFREQLGRRGN